MVNTDDFNDEVKWREAVRTLADKVDAIYLHIDADIVDCRFLPSVSAPEPNGPVETRKVPVVTLASIYLVAENKGIERNAESQAAILTGIRVIGILLKTGNIEYADI